MVDKTCCRGCNEETDMHRPIGEHWWARRDVLFSSTPASELWKELNA